MLTCGLKVVCAKQAAGTPPALLRERATEMPYKVFISHRWDSKDRMFAALLFEVFKSQHVDAFLDVEHLRYLGDLEAAVKSSEFFLIVLSQGANTNMFSS